MCDFSIIIPVYNTDKYLEQCIGSVLNQENCNLEIVLIDDGSVDRSGAICDLYQKVDSRIKVVHQINSGPSISRNYGLDTATGKYLMFMDSDDFLANNNVISDFISIFEQHNCDIIYGTYKGFVDDDYKSCTYKIFPKVLKIDNDQTKDLSMEEIVQLLFDNSNYYSSPTIKIYKREYLEINKFRFKENIYLEDEEWTPRILLNCKQIYFYNKKFYMRRIREESIMTTVNDEKRLKKIISMIEIATDMTQYTETKCKSTKLRNTFSEYYNGFRTGYMSLYREIKDLEIKEIAKEIIENTENIRGNLSELILVNPSKDLEEKILEYKQEYLDFEETNINGSCGLARYNNFDEWLDMVLSIEKDKLRNNVHASTFFSVRKSDNKIIGSIQLRHSLTDELQKHGGQIGYGIRPTERKKGYGKEQLLLVLKIAKDMKIPKVMISCDKDNIASSNTVIGCGGELTEENLYEGKEQQIYWINI